MATHKVWPSGSLSDTLPKDPIIKKLVMPADSLDVSKQQEYDMCGNYRGLYSSVKISSVTAQSLEGFKTMLSVK